LGVKNTERRKRTGFQVFLERFLLQGSFDRSERNLSPQVLVHNLGKDED